MFFNVLFTQVAYINRVFTRNALVPKWYLSHLEAKHTLLIRPSKTFGIAHMDRLMERCDYYKFTFTYTKTWGGGGLHHGTCCFIVFFQLVVDYVGHAIWNAMLVFIVSLSCELAT